MAWTIERIQGLISGQVEEDLHLDYKAAGALNLDDKKKEAISKDVSSFANSDGGVIIYGILEHTGVQQYMPDRIDPVSRKTISKETLEQVINHKISPRIQGVLIHPIVVNEQTPDEVIYVVEIPKGITAHQASDKRYYRRYNFQTIAMEDWEIKGIINRQQRTLAEVWLVPKFGKKLDSELLSTAGRTVSFDVMALNAGIKAVMLLDCMMATRDQNVAQMFVPQLIYKGQSSVHEQIFNNSYGPFTAQEMITMISQRMPREPISGLTYRKIGEVEMLTDFFIQNMAIQLTVVTEDNRTTKMLRGQELIRDRLLNGILE